MTRDQNKRIYEVMAVCLLILAAAVIRNVYLLQYEVRLPYYRLPIIDGAYYDTWAMRVADGQGYGPMPFYMAPLYPYVLALIYKVFGHNYTIVYFFQELLGVLNVFMVYLLGKRLFGHAAGLIAGLLITLYAPVVYLESKLLTETLAISLGLGSLLMLMQAMDRPTVIRFLLTGVMLGLSALCRPAALLAAALMALCLLWRRPVRGKMVAVMAAGVALAILPVTARNYFIGRDFALITTNGGICYAQSNSPVATGISASLGGFSSALEKQQQEEMAYASRALGHKVTASESAAFWFKLGLTTAKELPARFALLHLRKLAWSLHNREPACSYSVYFEQTLVPALRYLFMPFSLLAGLGLFGWLRSRKRDAGLLTLQIVSIYITMMVFAVSSRYRAPAVPVIAVFAGFGLIEGVNALKKLNLKAAAILVACLLGIQAVSFIRYPQPRIDAAAMGNLGSTFLEAGDVDRAIYYLNKTMQMEPSSMAHYVLGHALHKKGRLDDAVIHFKKAVEISPKDKEFRSALALALFQQEELRKRHP